MVIVHVVRNLGPYEDKSDRDLQDKVAEQVGELLVLIDKGRLSKLARDDLILATSVLNVMCIAMGDDD